MTVLDRQTQMASHRLLLRQKQFQLLLHTIDSLQRSIWDEDNTINIPPLVPPQPQQDTTTTQDKGKGKEKETEEGKGGGAGEAMDTTTDTTTSTTTTTTTSDVTMNDAL